MKLIDFREMIIKLLLWKRKSKNMRFIKAPYKSLRNRLLFYARHNKIKGYKNNTISCKKKTRFRHCNILVNGSNNKVIIGDYCDLRYMSILINGDDNCIDIGDNVTINALDFKPTQINACNGTTIRIGEGALLSNDVEIHTTDYHAIYDIEGGSRTNLDKDVIIGKNVWVGLGAKLLKGAYISDNSVVGACSLVIKKFYEENVVIAGNPAKVIKKDIIWER